MNKRFVLACVAVFATWMIGSFVVHGVLLHDDYARLSNIMRPEADAQRYFPLMILAHVILAVAFVWIDRAGSRQFRGCRKASGTGSRSRSTAGREPSVIFEHQRDEEATRMAAFPARDRDAFTFDGRKAIESADFRCGPPAK